MPDTNNSGRPFVKQDGRIEVTRAGQMVLLPQGYQFARMTIERLCEVDADSLTDLEKAAFADRVRHLIEIEEARLQRAEETRRRQLDFMRKYGK